MSAESNKAVKPDESQNPTQVVDKSRRSFAKVGATLAPVMMTLANRSAWGATNICTQSGFTSLQPSHGVVSDPPSGSNWLNYSSRLSSLTPSEKNRKLKDLWPTYFPGDNTQLDSALTVTTVGGDDELLAYKVATLLNKDQSPAPILDYLLNQELQVPPLTLPQILANYANFYTNCAS